MARAARTQPIIAAPMMAKHFVVTAPNLTVFERLKTDFKPAEGGQDIFDNDPLIPVAWRGDWSLSVILQDEASGASTGGTLYLTNIHRLYDTSDRKKKEPEAYDWVGPAVSRAKALDAGAELRKRITGHERVMVLNDEAHHVWDPGSAANEAISYLHKTIADRTGNGLVAQLDSPRRPRTTRAVASTESPVMRKAFLRNKSLVAASISGLHSNGPR